MDWQEPAALLVVGGTVLLMVAVRIRRFRKRGLEAMRRVHASAHPLNSPATSRILDHHQLERRIDRE